MTNVLIDGLLAAGRSEPDRVFAILPDGRRYTYGDVDSVSGRFATVLTGLGVQPGDRVAVQVEKSIEALMLYLGSVRAGGVFLPLNPDYTAAEIDYFLGDSTPRIFVCDPARRASHAASAERAGAFIETLGVWTSPQASAGSLSDKALDASPVFESIARGPADLAAILYTSGTTGRSKGAMLTHENLLSNARALRDEWRFTRDDVLLHALPIFHTHGLFVASNTVLISGGATLFLPKFDLAAVFAHLPQATSMMGVPTFYTRMLADERLTAEATRHVRLFVSGSAPLLAETHRSFELRTGHRILERYGMTETNMNTSNPYDGDRRPGTVGLPLPGVGLRIVDAESGAETPRGEIGVIEVKGPNVFAGYWQMPEKTKAEFRDDGYFITGDLGQADADGYVSIVGRSKDLVISGGFNVYPKEIEQAIDALPGVLESAVVGIAHPDFGEGVVAVVVQKPGSDVTESAISGALATDLARYKQPKHIVFVDDLPRNTMGKVQKNVLRDRFATIFADT